MGGVLWQGGGGYPHAHMWIFSHQQTASVTCSQRVSDSAYTAHAALLYSAKMTVPWFLGCTRKPMTHHQWSHVQEFGVAVCRVQHVLCYFQKELLLLHH